MSGTQTSRRAVILTALRLEYKAVRAHLSDVREEMHAKAVYEIGIFKTPTHTWEVCIAEVGATNEVAALAAQSAISYFNPNLALFVGVAGGLKPDDLSLGDVVCATKIYAYEIGKDTSEGFKRRTETGNSSFELVERAKNEGRKDDWQKRIQSPSSEINPTVHIAAIAAGNKLVRSGRIFELLCEEFSDAVAVEMEGYGFTLALHRTPEVNALVIRGISDLIADKTAEHDKKWQPIAARNASAFAFEILAKLPAAENLPPPLPAPIKQPEPFKENVPVTQPDPNAPIKIFYSYASQDQAFVDQLNRQLSTLRRLNFIETSYANDAGVGRKELLNQADIILLLISPYFIDTFEIYSEEAKRAMARRKEGVRVIPVLIRPTADWQLEEFGDLMAIPRDKPVSLYNDKDVPLSAIAKEIRGVVASIRKDRGLPPI